MISTSNNQLFTGKGDLIRIEEPKCESSGCNHHPTEPKKLKPHQNQENPRTRTTFLHTLLVGEWADEGSRRGTRALHRGRGEPLRRILA